MPPQASVQVSNPTWAAHEHQGKPASWPRVPRQQAAVASPRYPISGMLRLHGTDVVPLVNCRRGKPQCRARQTEGRARQAEGDGPRGLYGPKRATAAAIAEYEVEGVSLPRPGSFWIATDGAGRARPFGGPAKFGSAALVPLTSLSHGGGRGRGRPHPRVVVGCPRKVLPPGTFPLSASSLTPGWRQCSSGSRWCSLGDREKS
jgi:hypothetical protein